MNKELEALKRLYAHLDAEDLGGDDYYINDNAREDFTTIETALKEHELMKQTKFIVADTKISKEDLEKIKNQRMFVSDLQPCEIKLLFDEETQKKLKALEIIREIVKKDEEIDFMSLFGNSMVNVGNSYEEVENKYNLLKEELL